MNSHATSLADYQAEKAERAVKPLPRLTSRLRRQFASVGLLFTASTILYGTWAYPYLSWGAVVFTVFAVAATVTAAAALAAFHIALSDGPQANGPHAS